MNLHRHYRLGETLDTKSIERMRDLIEVDQRFVVIDSSSNELRVERRYRNPLVLSFSLIVRIADGADGRSIVSIEAVPAPGTFGDIFRMYPRAVEELGEVVLSAVPGHATQQLSSITSAQVPGVQATESERSSRRSSLLDFAIGSVAIGVGIGAAGLLARAVGVPDLLARAVGLVIVVLGIVILRRRRP